MKIRWLPWMCSIFREAMIADYANPIRKNHWAWFVWWLGAKLKRRVVSAA
jgi:hypothetical protein